MDQQKPGSGSSSSLHHNRHYDLDKNDHQIALTLSEFPQIDKEVARRLTKFEPVKHIPRINGSIPTYDDASADHRRLLDRLDLYGLTEQKIKGDGNCQFRALSDQLYRTPEHHKFVRKSVVTQLKTTPDAYSNYVPMKYIDYLKNMAKNGEWGDHVTLQAAADYYGVKISLITSFKDTCFIEIVPTEQKSKREMYLSFWAEVHYNSIYPIGGFVQVLMHPVKVRKPVPGCMLKLSYFGGMFVVVTLSMWRWGDWWSDLPRSLDGDHTLLGYSHSSS